MDLSDLSADKDTLLLIKLDNVGSETTYDVYFRGWFNIVANPEITAWPVNVYIQQMNYPH
jgi:hypothetical protein